MEPLYLYISEAGRLQAGGADLVFSFSSENKIFNG